MPNDRTQMIRVWDPFVRAAHWGLVIAFAVAYLTEGEPLTIHSWAGYVIAAIIVLRIVWGFVGPHHARFGTFVYGPSTVLSYLRDLLLLRSKRYVGHSPAGGAMVVALLLSLGATTLTGMAYLAQDKNAGPFAPWLGHPSAETAATATGPSANSMLDSENGEDEDTLKEVHEFFANLSLALVFLHVAGVTVASLAHRENLPRAMITGRKRPEAHTG